MIPADRGSVSAGFLLRLLIISSPVGVSPVTKTELVKRASIQFEEATMSDLLYPSTSPLDQNFYDTELVLAVLESYLKFWKRISPDAVDNRHLIKSIRSVAKLIDSYLQVVARDDNMPAIGRLEHDDLYQAINIYLKVNFFHHIHAMS
ncbi:BTB/POZ domain-containing protein [Glycine max]|nr:BTB/POZ domain-containing protein [Glycine max]